MLDVKPEPARLTSSGGRPSASIAVLPTAAGRAKGLVDPAYRAERREVVGKGLDCGAVIFKRIGDGRPYPDHGKRHSEWAQIPPRQVRLEELVTTKRQLDLDTLLATDSTYYGDLFAHVVQWDGELYLEDGLHRAVRAALQQRPTLHARVLDLDTGTTTQVTDSERSAS
jgi:Arc/MetJ family transcription regulator